MERLTTNSHCLLKENVLELLKQRQISTVDQFLREDSKNLMKITKFDLEQLKMIKQALFKYIGISPIDGLTHYQLLMAQSVPISTGIQKYS